MKPLLIALACVVPMGVAPWAAAAEALAPMALNGFSRPPYNIVSAPVENLRGQVVGYVSKVATDRNGKPAALIVVTAKGTVTVAADAASFDESHRLVIANLPERQAQNRPR